MESIKGKKDLQVFFYQQDQIRALYNQAIKNNSNHNIPNKKSGVYWHFKSSIIKGSYMFSRYGIEGMPPNFGSNVNFTMEQARSLQFCIILSHASSEEHPILAHYEVYNSQNKKILDSEYEIVLKKGNDRIFFNLVIHQPGLYRITAMLNNSFICEYYFGVLNPDFVEEQKKIFIQDPHYIKKATEKPQVLSLSGITRGSIIVILVIITFTTDNLFTYFAGIIFALISCILHIRKDGFLAGIGRAALSMVVSVPVGLISYVIFTAPEFQSAFFIMLLLFGFPTLMEMITEIIDVGPEIKNREFVAKSSGYKPYEVNLEKPYGGHLVRNEDDSYRDTLDGDSYDVDGYTATNKTTGEIHNLL